MGLYTNVFDSIWTFKTAGSITFYNIKETDTLLAIYTT